MEKSPRYKPEKLEDQTIIIWGAVIKASDYVTFRIRLSALLRDYFLHSAGLFEIILKGLERKLTNQQKSLIDYAIMERSEAEVKFRMNEGR